MEQPKINIAKPSQLELDLKAEMDKGKTIEEATKIVHERYQKEAIED
jgi:hypothetical protein